MKKTKAYVIQNPDNQIFLDTIRIKQKDCFTDFMKSVNNPKLLWRHYLKNGWKCVKITIEIAPTLKKKPSSRRRENANI